MSEDTIPSVTEFAMSLVFRSSSCLNQEFYSSTHLNDESAFGEPRRAQMDVPKLLFQQAKNESSSNKTFVVVVAFCF